MAYQLDEIAERDESQSPSLSASHVSGWYPFCGRPSHVPYGVSIRHGKEKMWGRLVEDVSNDEKDEDLEFVVMWQTGVIEEGFEHRWEPKHFQPSCDLSDAVQVINVLFDQDIDDDVFLRKTQSSVLDPLAVRKITFFGSSFDEFRESVGESPDLEKIVKFICSRCGVVICLNRQSPFFDDKLFRKLVEKPESVISL
ncbi:MAG: hypothetical protein JSW61_08630 [Candidatus Thorarchaeota archaeon]|nr:MAG: hypothetical protein JSW61_08630 [Candidatus Thorarchaeota archaeon]